MKIIQVPYWFYPSEVRGTEIYVESLSQILQAQNIDIVIVAPGDENQSYFHNQLSVRRFPASDKIVNLREMYGEGDTLAAEEFGKILDEEQPDLVHIHVFNRAVSIKNVRAAKCRGIPVVFTYHAATVGCVRGTLLRYGENICDGKLDEFDCARCNLQNMGLSRINADLLGSLPASVGKFVDRLNLSGKVSTVLRTTELVSCYHSAFKDLMFEVDHIVAVCDWVKDVLILNDVPAKKITTIRQGVSKNLLASENFRQETYNENNNIFNSDLRIVFLGRLDTLKGIDILIKALQIDVQLPVTLDIYGASQEQIKSTSPLIQLAKTDKRITFKSTISHKEILRILPSYSLLAVPSQCLETGPMVILEAFDSGIPVIGSNLGGIAELIKHESNGLLVEASSVNAWYLGIKRICEDKNLYRQLCNGISKPQTMQMVAGDMLNLYNKILKN